MLKKFNAATNTNVLKNHYYGFKYFYYLNLFWSISWPQIDGVYRIFYSVFLTLTNLKLSAESQKQFIFYYYCKMQSPLILTYNR